MIKPLLKNQPVFGVGLGQQKYKIRFYFFGFVCKNYEIESLCQVLILIILTQIEKILLN